LWLAYLLSKRERKRPSAENLLEGARPFEPLNKCRLSIVHRIPEKTVDTTIQLMKEERKPLAQRNTEEKNPEGCLKKSEEKENWEDFNSAWWNNLATS
jgi:hypothetical protein